MILFVALNLKCVHSEDIIHCFIAEHESTEYIIYTAEM